MWVLVVLAAATLAMDVLVRERSHKRRWDVKVGMAKHALQLADTPAEILRRGKAELVMTNTKLVMAGEPPMTSLADLHTLLTPSPEVLQKIQENPEQSGWWPLICALQEAEQGSHKRVRKHVDREPAAPQPSAPMAEEEGAVPPWVV